MSDEKDPAMLTQAELNAPVEAEAEQRELDGVEAKRLEDQQRIAEHMAHPHTRLTNLQKQMAAPGSLDVTGRIGMLHSVLSQLVQIIKEHTPAPNEPGDANGQG